jgi:hypothetical protein
MTVTGAALPRVGPAALAADALLRRYVESGAYTDCYAVDVEAVVKLAAYVAAFYTTPLFRVERWILKWAAGKPPTDDEALALAAGKGESFAAWRVEDRTADQLLLGDFTGRTKSWLKVEPVSSGAGRMRLYFGSAVVPRVDPKTGARTMGTGFTVLLGFHRLYSRLLLGAAAKRVVAQALAR